MLGLFLTVKPQISAGNILTGIQPVLGTASPRHEAGPSGNPSVCGPGESVGKHLTGVPEPQQLALTWPLTLHTQCLQMGERKLPERLTEPLGPE